MWIIIVLIVIAGGMYAAMQFYSAAVRPMRPGAFWTLLLVVLLCSVAASYKSCVNGMREDVAALYPEYSSEGAKGIGKLVRRYDVHPRTLRKGDWTVVFSEAWAERRADVRYRFLFFPECRLRDDHQLALKVGYDSRMPGERASLAGEGGGSYQVGDSDYVIGFDLPHGPPDTLRIPVRDGADDAPLGVITLIAREPVREPE